MGTGACVEVLTGRAVGTAIADADADADADAPGAALAVDGASVVAATLAEGSALDEGSAFVALTVGALGPAVTAATDRGGLVRVHATPAASASPNPTITMPAPLPSRGFSSSAFNVGNRSPLLRGSSTFATSLTSAGRAGAGTDSRSSTSEGSTVNDDSGTTDCGASSSTASGVGDNLAARAGGGSFTGGGGNFASCGPFPEGGTLAGGAATFGSTTCGIGCETGGFFSVGGSISGTSTLRAFAGRGDVGDAGVRSCSMPSKPKNAGVSDSSFGSFSLPIDGKRDGAPGRAIGQSPRI